MAQPQHGSQQRPGIGPAGEARGAFALGLGADCRQTGERGANTVLQTMQRLVVPAAGETGQQLMERRRHQFEHLCRIGADLAVRARRQHQEGHQKAGERADGDFQHAIDRRIQHVGMVHDREQQHDDGRYRCDVQAGIDGGDERQRRYRQHQHREQRAFAIVRDQDRDRRAVKRAADRADQIVAGRLERAPDAHLGDDDGGQHRP